MNLTAILRFFLILGIIGHAINMYCDRIISIFPNGTLSLKNMDEIGKGDFLSNLLKGVSPKVPMRSAILGAFALLLQFFGYFALAVYMYGQSRIYGSIMFFAFVIFIVIGTAHHVKCAMAEYVFIKMGRDEKAKKVMLELFNGVPITRVCYVGYLVYLITLIVAIITGVAEFPLWGLIFTVIPVFIALFPFRIIGTLHLAAMASMFAWIFLIW